MLWIALYLPELPLQLAQRACPRLRACVIVDGPATRPLVHCANAAARECGVTPQMPLAAARALTGDLVVLPRDAAAEAQALHNLACWAGQFTPNVVVQKSEGLLLEVESTLTLHGGRTHLIRRIRDGIKELGYYAEPGIAPTPRAAWVLAKARLTGLRVRMCSDIASVPACLQQLPLTLLDWPADVMKTMQTLGIYSIGQCLQLPRDGFIQRFGFSRQRDLDMMIGTLADPRAWFTPPDNFSSHVDFGFDVNDALALLFPLKRLLQELEGFLRARGAGVQQWQLQLDHWSHRKTTIAIGTIAPERSAERLLALAKEKISNMSLIGPVLALRISVDQLLLFEENNRSFIPDPRSRAIGWSHLLDKLSVRLGSDKAYRLRALDDHRPEQAWQRSTAVAAKAAAPLTPTACALSPRPLWLLNTPRALLTNAGAPLCQGRLRMLAGPERIEAGWWDGKRARRDYYVARNPGGETLWIYREHQRSYNWYLHGIFA